VLQSYRENDQVYERAIVGMVEEWDVPPRSIVAAVVIKFGLVGESARQRGAVRVFAAKAPVFLPGRDEQAVKYSPTVPALAIVT